MCLKKQKQQINSENELKNSHKSQCPLQVSKSSCTFSFPCNDMVIEDWFFSQGGKVTVQKGDLRRVSSALRSAGFFFTHSWCCGSLLAVCFGPLAMVAENLQCVFLSFPSGKAMGHLFIFPFSMGMCLRVCACACLRVCGSVWYGCACTGMWTDCCVSLTIMRVLSLQIKLE